MEGPSGKPIDLSVGYANVISGRRQFDGITKSELCQSPPRASTSPSRGSRQKWLSTLRRGGARKLNWRELKARGLC
jgi:hypothetical protein